MSNNGWMPIESAPKDGREFIAAWGHQAGVMRFVSYNKIHGFFQSKGEPILGFMNNATHWRESPPKPTGEDA